MAQYTPQAAHNVCRCPAAPILEGRVPATESSHDWGAPLHRGGKLCFVPRRARARAPKSLPRSLNNEVMATCASNSHSATARRAPLHGQKACQNDCALRAAQAESLAGACARQALGRPTLLRCLRQFLRCQPTQQRLSHPWEHNVGEAHC